MLSLIALLIPADAQVLKQSPSLSADASQPQSPPQSGNQDCPLGYTAYDSGRAPTGYLYEFKDTNATECHCDSEKEPRCKAVIHGVPSGSEKGTCRFYDNGDGDRDITDVDLTDFETYTFVCRDDSAFPTTTRPQIDESNRPIIDESTESTKTEDTLDESSKIGSGSAIFEIGSGPAKPCKVSAECGETSICNGTICIPEPGPNRVGAALSISEENGTKTETLGWSDGSQKIKVTDNSGLTTTKILGIADATGNRPIIDESTESTKTEDIQQQGQTAQQQGQTAQEQAVKEVTSQKNAFPTPTKPQIDETFPTPTKPQIDETTLCPTTHPYAFRDGDYCCKTEKDLAGNELTLISRNCEGRVSTRCNARPCKSVAA